MSDKAQLRLAMGLAYRHFKDTDTTEAEQEAILAVMIEDLGGMEGETASRILQNRRDSERLQLQLGFMLSQKGSANG